MSEILKIEELSDALDSAFNDCDVVKHIEELRLLLSVKRNVDFTQDYFMNFNFELQDPCTRDYYYGKYYFHYFKRFYDAVIKENTQEEIEELINQVLNDRNND